jgi:hypothetical protein
LYKVDPSICVLARNLLSNDDCRAALVDEPEPGGPKVPLVIKPCAFACRAERLARAGAGPDGAVVGPSGGAECVTPDADAREKMALSVRPEIGWRDIFDAPGINVAGRDLPSLNQFAQPRCRKRVDFIVIGCHVIWPQW